MLRSFPDPEPVPVCGLRQPPRRPQSLSLNLLPGAPACSCLLSDFGYSASNYRHTSPHKLLQPVVPAQPSFLLHAACGDVGMSGSWAQPAGHALLSTRAEKLGPLPHSPAPLHLPCRVSPALVRQQSPVHAGALLQTPHRCSPWGAQGPEGGEWRRPARSRRCHMSPREAAPGCGCSRPG